MSATGMHWHGTPKKGYLKSVPLISAAQKAMAEGAGAAERKLALQTFETMAQTLGFRTERWGEAKRESSEDALLKLLAEIRKEARGQKLWAISDKIRDGLAAAGYEVRDGKDGSVEVVGR